MDPRAIDPHKRAEVLRLKAKGYTHRLIAEIADVSVSTVSKVSNSCDTVEVDRIDAYAEFHREKFLELQERFNKWLGDTAPARPGPKRKAGKRIRAAVASDFHVPYHSEQAVAQFISQNQGQVDEVWIAGDFQDLFAVSRYPHTKRNFSPIEEFQQSRVVLRALSEAFPKVVMMPGNHDSRWIKFLNQQKQIPADVLEFMEFMCPGCLDPLSKLCAMFPNVDMVEPKKLGFASYPHFHQRGDLILAHAERFSVIPNKAVTDVVEHLMKRSLPMGVVEPFRVVMMGHTHHLGMCWGPYGAVGIETGCLADTPDYDGSPKLGGGGPPVLGYVVTEQAGGITDINSTRMVQL